MNKKLVSILAVAVLGMGGCTNMTPTQQGALSGAAIGAGAGAGISALSGGNAGVGALLGGALGGVGGALYGHEQEKPKYRRTY
ncbi:glycine zipper domain-containing protein [Fundidesulfovibrio terrae]|uniref:glycine zipper domain-containing protein n=1 Tax=Fundidesulfovibrio terrae TaxID=2922866 RepID=UPI001FAF2C50|nr:glycine zipper domain-containing protein [Fundidesulfovibrio terrae]